MKNQMVWIIAAVIVALILVFRGRQFQPAGTTTQLNIGANPASLPNAQILSGIGTLGASISRALSGNSPLPSGTEVPAYTSSQPISGVTASNAFYAQGIAGEQGTLEEPTFGNNTNSFTIVGTGPAPIAAPNVTPSNQPTPGVLSFLNPNGNVPPPAAVDAGTGNYGTSSAAIGAVPTNYGATGVSLDSGTSGYEVDALTNIFGDSSYT